VWKVVELMILCFGKRINAAEARQFAAVHYRSRSTQPTFRKKIWPYSPNSFA
jgi:hypothetical protein